MSIYKLKVTSVISKFSSVVVHLISYNTNKLWYTEWYTLNITTL